MELHFPDGVDRAMRTSPRGPRPARRSSSTLKSSTTASADTRRWGTYPQPSTNGKTLNSLSTFRGELQTAYHEAGHMVAAVEFDLPCVPFVSIRPNDQSSGRCDVHWPQDAAPPTGEQAFNYVRLLFCGYLAERYAGPVSLDWVLELTRAKDRTPTGPSDLLSVLEMAKILELTTEHLLELYEETEELVDSQDRLLKLGGVGGADVLALGLLLDHEQELAEVALPHGRDVPPPGPVVSPAFHSPTPPLTPPRHGRSVHLTRHAAATPPSPGD